MKKHLFLAILAGAALVGCVKNEQAVRQDNRVKVGFNTPVLYSNLDTRANVHGEIGTYTYPGTGTTQYTYPREESFTIFAVQHVGNLTSWDDAEATEFNGQGISWNNSLDAWAPLKGDGGFYYWPDGKLLSFAAVSPADLNLTGVTPTYTSTGLLIEDFVVNDDPQWQYDLLYSERAVNKSAIDLREGANYYSGVSILFQHALTSIHFSLKTDADVTEEVVLTSIKLKNAKNKGTFNENITNETAYASEPEWTPSEDRSTADYVSFSGKVTFPLQAQYVSSIAAQDTDEDGEEDVSHSLLVMPQELDDDVVVEIKYLVGEEQKTKDIQLNEYPKGSGLTPITEWAVGTRYTYRLYYSSDSEKKDIIFFSPETDSWTDAEIIEVLL